MYTRAPASRINKMIPMSEKKTILYVEDNSDNRKLIRRILEAEGYAMMEASNAGEALSALDANNLDLILMDINMPDVDGYTLTSQIRQIPAHAKVPIIAVTANVMRGDREKSLEAGCDGYIQKPIDVDALPKLIERFMRNANV